jgi:hypothetical protein
MPIKDAFNRIWDRNFAQVRSIFELYISGLQDETIRKNAESTRVLIEEALYQTRKALDETRQDKK